MCYATKDEEKVAVSLMTGLLAAPVYTPQQAAAATLLLGAAGAMALSSGRWSMQLSLSGIGAAALPGGGVATLPGGGVNILAGEILAALEAAVIRAAGLLTASTVGPMVAAAALMFVPLPAGEGSDRVPGRNQQAMFAMNARLLAGKNVAIGLRSSSVNLPVRGALVERNGQLTLELLKTGNGVSAAVQVLNAVRDAATGLDIITLPAVGGMPPRTILVNPVPVPTGPGNTGNQTPVPVTPLHTGTDVKPVDNIVVTPPAGDIGELWDFIYWRPNAAGTGVEPIYVMLSSPYGETNARGQYSGRDYNTDKAGGPIQNLDWKGATIDRAGIDKVKLHTGRFGEVAENKVMIERLEKILKGELAVTDTDKRFYTHEIRELERYRALGIADGIDLSDGGATWNNTHTATLEDYKLSSDWSLLYTPETLKIDAE